MQRRAGALGVLEQDVNPLLTGLPLGLLGSVAMFDLGVLVSGTAFFGKVSYWVLTAGLLVGLVVMTVLLVNLTTGPIGVAARRALGVVSAATTGMVVLFAMVWWVRTDGDAAGNVGLLVLELFALAGGGAGAWYGRPGAVGRGLFESMPMGPTALPLVFGSRR